MMIGIQLVAVVILATIERSASVQRFTEAPGYSEVNPGEDALLACRVADKKGLCSWQKDNKPVGIHKGKYEWANEDSPTGGDCSLWVRAATLALDDGQWQCQVTASTYDVQDALSSAPATLAVRVAPQAPRILFNGTHVLPGESVTVQAGSRATVVCEARYGNPPAYIEWYLETERLSAWSQTNSSEVERPRVWAARSVLELEATRASHGRQLACRAAHPAYPAPHYRQAYTLLDVTFAPTVSIEGVDTLGKLEEGSSVVSLECKAEGNPSPHVWWTRDGQTFNNTGPNLILAPLSRKHSGIYACQARNSLGVSETAKVEIDVKYPPRVLWVGPEAALQASLFSRVMIECKAEGNPPPVYRWLYRPGGRGGSSGELEEDVVVSSSAQLVLHNVTYKQHGQYVCVAVNHIGFHERSHRSEPLTLNVLGPPQGVAAVAARAWSGGEAVVGVDVCADPPPSKAVWRWGSLRLNVPSQLGRHRAMDPSRAGDCYRYKLVISPVAAEDARVYVLHVENDRGATTHAVTLAISQTSQLVPLVAAGLVILVLLGIIFCLVRRCRRARDTVQYKTEDLDNEKGSVLPADAVYSSRDAPHQDHDWPTQPPPTRGPYASAATGAPYAPTAGPQGGRYSPGALQAALASLEREAKDNIYAILDPHVQYDVTVSKHGTVPKHLTLSAPIHNPPLSPWEQSLSTFRTHRDDRGEIKDGEERNARNVLKSHRSNRSRETKIEHEDKVRKSGRSARKGSKRVEHLSRSNRDVQYRDADRAMERRASSEHRKTKNLQGSQRRHEQNGGHVRHDRQGSKRSGQTEFRRDQQQSSQKRASTRSVRYDRNLNLFEGDVQDRYSQNGGAFPSRLDRESERVLRANSGMVRALASKFNRSGVDNAVTSGSGTRNRPKPLQAVADQRYLDRMFPVSIEI